MGIFFRYELTGTALGIRIECANNLPQNLITLCLFIKKSISTKSLQKSSKLTVHLAAVHHLTRSHLSLSPGPGWTPAVRWTAGVFPSK